MGNYLTTINHDLQGWRKLILEGQSSANFNSVTVYSLFRDICLMLYETNKVLKEDGIIKSDLPNIDMIKEIRHKVKTNQGIKNREIFNKLLNGHKSLFGNDIDNLGFYIDGEVLASSTFFTTFIFAGTPLENRFDKESTLKYLSVVGSLTNEIISIINQPTNLPSNPLMLSNEEEYILKDIWDKRFFKEDITYNIFLTRLLLAQTELTTCVWMKNHLNHNSQKLNLDKYILLRLTSIKLYETMRNILDLRNRLSKHWRTFNLNTLDSLINEYENTHRAEIKTLRDMLHYNNKGTNFYDYIEKKIYIDPQYPDRQIQTIFNSYIHTIRNSISMSIDIQSYESMNDFEKIKRRIKSLLKIN
ncbi:hypothetical protein [Bacillus glycinifermentans]|uniref:hypothetical protein n=1 Tax=Bacillus glycinifermentans TaxID=1664069 RepID=UPI000BC3426E|nr:hypothetical protein [Bacillus glycinifermentans]ATH91720.1 hypothetical protein COP00_03085 [Bacillus glycinifermentans]